MSRTIILIFEFVFQELEQIEEDWRKESSHLLTVIAKLQDENRRLTSIIAKKSCFEGNFPQE